MKELLFKRKLKEDSHTARIGKSDRLWLSDLRTVNVKSLTSPVRAVWLTMKPARLSIRAGGLIADLLLIHLLEEFLDLR
ncbi:MAG: hypothetical protein AAF960_02830 [Bacteroidota bacterium]